MKCILDIKGREDHMTDKQDLKRLSRAELLEMLLEQGKENEQLQEKVKELQGKLDDRNLHLTKVGSIAEAALALNGVFEAAEASCLQYIENIRLLSERQDEIAKVREDESREEAAKILQEAKERCMLMEADTKAKCSAQIAEADKRVEEKWAQISKRLTDLYKSHEGLLEIVSQGMSLVPGKDAENGTDK